MKRLLLVLALTSISVTMSACTKRQPDTQQAEEGQCKLQFKAAKNSESIPSLAHQYQSPVSERPSQLNDLPEGLSEDSKYFVAKLADREVPVVLDFSENWQHSVLYVDTDGDGHLSNEERYSATPTEERGSAFRFGPVRLELDTRESKVKTEFYVMTRRGRYLTFYPTGYPAGEIRLGTKVYKVAVIDGNFDGHYDEVYRPQMESGLRPHCDLFCIDLNGDGQLKHDTFGLSEIMPLTSMARLNDAYYCINLAPDGSQLELTRAEPEFGTLYLGGEDVTAKLWSGATRHLLYPSQQRPGSIKIDLGGIKVTLTSGPEAEGPLLWNAQRKWRLPAGRHAALFIALTKTDSAGNRWSFMSLGETGKLRDFEIQAGRDTLFDLGPPLSYRTSVEQIGEEVLSIGVTLQGQAGELYGPGVSRNGERVAAPSFKIISESGEVIGTGQFRYG